GKYLVAHQRESSFVEQVIASQIAHPNVIVIGFEPWISNIIWSTSYALIVKNTFHRRVHFPDIGKGYVLSRKLWLIDQYLIIRKCTIHGVGMKPGVSPRKLATTAYKCLVEEHKATSCSREPRRVESRRKKQVDVLKSNDWTSYFRQIDKRRERFRFHIRFRSRIP